jgi:hypothetical protein
MIDLPPNKKYIKLLRDAPSRHLLRRIDFLQWSARVLEQSEREQKLLGRAVEFHIIYYYDFLLDT